MRERTGQEAALAGREIVDPDDAPALRKQPIDKRTADEAGSTGDEVLQQPAPQAGRFCAIVSAATGIGTSMTRMTSSVARSQGRILVPKRTAAMRIGPVAGRM